MGELLCPDPFLDRNNYLFGLPVRQFHPHFYRFQPEIIGNFKRHRHTRDVCRQIITIRRKQLEFRRLISLDYHLQVGHIFVFQTLLVNKSEVYRAVRVRIEVKGELFGPV